MDFYYTEEQVLLQDMLRKFLSENYGHDLRCKTIEAGNDYDQDTFNSLSELGVMGALFPEHLGGYGGSGFDIAIVFEELGRAGVIKPVLGSALLAGRLFSAVCNQIMKISAAAAY